MNSIPKVLSSTLGSVMWPRLLDVRLCSQAVWDDEDEPADPADVGIVGANDEDDTVLICDVCKKTTADCA